MAILTTLKDGVTKEYTITQQQAEQLKAFIEDSNYSPDTEINGVKKSEMVSLTFDKKPEQPFYYTVRLSYNDKDQDVTIGSKEMPAVYWAFLKETKAVTSVGLFRGKDIISVLPDFHKILGFNKGYDLQPEDFRLIGTDPTCIKAVRFLEEVKQVARTVDTVQELNEKINRLLLN